MGSLEKILTVVKTGVYRHEIIGVFDDVDLAINYATESMSQEKDDWHRFVVLEFEVNKIVYDGRFVAEIRREGGKIIRRDGQKE